MSTDRTPWAAGSVDVIVIGAGQSGLAMSYFLTARGIEHVVLERGAIANSWRRERWDSLRLLTPNWQSCLPDYAYAGERPDDFMTMPEIVAFISGYASFARAPVHTGVEVQSVTSVFGGYRVGTNHGSWFTRAVVLASGAFNRPHVPALSQNLPPGLHQITAFDYRNPDSLPPGGALVVGGSATGLQLAAEIHASGRPVTMATGEHLRMPRTYRGFDIQHWMQVTGLLDQRYDEFDDLDRLRKLPSPQLIGSEQRSTLDLNALADRGVRLCGRLAGLRDGHLQFSGSLRNVCRLADLKLNRLLDGIDRWIEINGGLGATAPYRLLPTRIVDPPCLAIDLRAGGISTVVWATGYRPDYSWLQVPVFDRKRQVRHDGGVVEAPGMYILGLPFMRRRKSSFIHGAEDDARELSQHLAAHLDAQSRARAFKFPKSA